MCQMHESALFLGAPRAQGSPFLLERVMWSVSPALTVQSRDWDSNRITFMPGFASFFRWGCSRKLEWKRGTTNSSQAAWSWTRRCWLPRACPRQG